MNNVIERVVLKAVTTLLLPRLCNLDVASWDRPQDCWCVVVERR
jgi:hypothetical protein